MASYNYVTTKGIVVPDTSTTRAEVEQEFRAVFGADIQLEPSTPAGALVSRIVETRDFVIRNNAELANQINPDIAGGIFLDALGRLSGADRPGTIKSRIFVRLRGNPGLTVPAGFIVISNLGHRYTLINDAKMQVTGGGFGMVETWFQAELTGYLHLPTA